jgi:hypothetical protein
MVKLPVNPQFLNALSPIEVTLLKMVKLPVRLVQP